MMTQNNTCEGLRILRFPEVVRKTGISRSGVYARIRAGEFPKPVSLGDRTVGFLENEVDSFITNLMKQRSEASAT